MDLSVKRIGELIDWRIRLHQYVMGLVAVVFLAIYGRAVCPFINGIEVINWSGSGGV